MLPNLLPLTVVLFFVGSDSLSVFFFLIITRFFVGSDSLSVFFFLIITCFFVGSHSLSDFFFLVIIPVSACPSSSNGKSYFSLCFLCFPLPARPTAFTFFCDTSLMNAICSSLVSS